MAQNRINFKFKNCQYSVFDNVSCIFSAKIIRIEKFDFFKLLHAADFLELAISYNTYYIILWENETKGHIHIFLSHDGPYFQKSGLIIK